MLKVYLFECICTDKHYAQFHGSCEHCRGRGCVEVTQEELEEAQRPLSPEEMERRRQLVRNERF